MYDIYAVCYVAIGVIYFSGDYIAAVLKNTFGRHLVSHKKIIGMLYLLLSIVAFSAALNPNDDPAPNFRFEQAPYQLNDGLLSTEDLVV